MGAVAEPKQRFRHHRRARRIGDARSNALSALELVRRDRDENLPHVPISPPAPVPFSELVGKHLFPLALPFVALNLMLSLERKGLLSMPETDLCTFSATQPSQAWAIPFRRWASALVGSRG